MQGKIIFLISFIVLVTVFVLSNNVYTQAELHVITLYEIANHTSSNKSSAIPVGKNPSGIDVNVATNTIYVANSDDNTF